MYIEIRKISNLGTSGFKIKKRFKDHPKMSQYKFNLMVHVYILLQIIKFGEKLFQEVRLRPSLAST